MCIGNRRVNVFREIVYPFLSTSVNYYCVHHFFCASIIVDDGWTTNETIFICFVNWSMEDGHFSKHRVTKMFIIQMFCMISLANNKWIWIDWKCVTNGFFFVIWYDKEYCLWHDMLFCLSKWKTFFCVQKKGFHAEEKLIL